MEDEKMIKIAKFLNRYGWGFDFEDDFWMEEELFKEETVKDIIEIMEEYHQSELREELVKFCGNLESKGGNSFANKGWLVDNYVKEKEG